MVQAIDIICNLFTPTEVENDQTGLDDTFKAQVRMARADWGGVEMDDYIRRMDEAGIERSFLAAVRCGDMNIKGSYEISYERVAEVCAKYPDRFSGLAGLDPTRGMQGLRDLDMAVKDYGFIGAHFYPHWFGLAPDHAKWYPYYAKCCELDIPVMLQVGHNLVYSRERRLPSVGRPIALDQVAIDFPDLAIIGIHIGVPWTDEMISMAWKHANIYIGVDAYAPKHWPPQIVHYLNTYGRGKVLFGTDWPVIDPIRGVSEIAAMGLRPESHEALMRDTAVSLFKLDAG
ncbi:amidohydrolase family protein [Marinibacterium profundimaris]|uniref:amidohydrolase family protein n=1 Tax=Marinibacterium profundimaris TaxID=1679460 RepID=UPI0013033B90|nr:amidohydrolase family protein [Marinibacterium profundimaris]